MREYLLVIYLKSILHVIHYSCLNLIIIMLNSTYVKMCISWRRCAWLVNKRLFTSHQRLNEEHLKNKKGINFKQWLQMVIFIFHIDKWGLSFKIAQSRYNLRVLHYIKTELGVRVNYKRWYKRTIFYKR